MLVQFDMEEHPLDAWLNSGQSTEVWVLVGFFVRSVFCVELVATSQRLLLCV